MQHNHPAKTCLWRLHNSCVIHTADSPSSPSIAAAIQMQSTAASSSHGLFDHVPQAPEDAILGLNLAYKADPCPDKIDLGVGAYRTEEGKPYVLPVIRKVEKLLAEDVSLNKEYLPIDGLPDFVNESVKLILGADSPAIAENRVAKVQALSGTGALRLGAAFLSKFNPASTPVYLSDPTWGNHVNIFRDAGFTDLRKYPYWEPQSRGLNYDGMTKALKEAPAGSIIVLHTCAHNPTGVDPTVEQWDGITDVLKGNKLIPFFDTAYQGFATGDIDKDAASVRMAVAKGLELFVSQSYSKNFGLYGERIGALNVVCANTQVAEAVRSQLKALARAMYSNPPKHGALVVSTILKNPQFYDEWIEDLKMMAGRIVRMRHELHDAIQKNGTPGTWQHIVDQIGMFSYTGLSPQQSKAMTEKHHIYMLGNGRISMAGLSSRNVQRVADAIHDVVTNIN
ncbi:Aspartate aminotransferase [Balamuthia mandrillaris]